MRTGVRRTKTTRSRRQRRRGEAPLGQHGRGGESAATRMLTDDGLQEQRRLIDGRAGATAGVTVVHGK
ncbi:hypothetical protein E2562_007465 [Oryza meyeriana var. granulata]|uniref:Uncharacterized protein n=1 Tax=Oryza meyeriana var. granulata TaxID=110450 RepID=A0A6G1F523_9ORYZ|nr:hypothetical protein E2562_007465 [Oryza meyeriana var. granulata]